MSSTNRNSSNNYQTNQTTQGRVRFEEESTVYSHEATRNPRSTTSSRGAPHPEDTRSLYARQYSEWNTIKLAKFTHIANSPQSQPAPNTTGNRGYIEAPQLQPPEQSYGSEFTWLARRATVLTKEIRQRRGNVHYAGQFVKNSVVHFTPSTPQGVNTIPLPNIGENNNQEAWRRQASPYQYSPVANSNQPPLTTVWMSTSATALPPAPEGVNIIALQSIGGNESAETRRGRGRVSAYPSSSMRYPMTVNEPAPQQSFPMNTFPVNNGATQEEGEEDRRCCRFC
ncbi:uncharacterized protein C8R40DRAFT_1171749 [Lentinula edodes]|uniref:uncharacterized protein n=1 Tax=Lentinula edodes TaxID=5353 RepID=UPI001E8DE164|nr:uncharacterized protein C8R40DRAFT_1171749 [Lentinula edodes]KAH7874214.1 hypothetical protein C8R40DRAFT_1171749 [Lentinula edodes]